MQIGIFFVFSEKFWTFREILGKFYEKLSENDKKNATHNSNTSLQKKHFRRSRREKRAGIPDAVLSSGARSAPELRPASGSQGLASGHQENVSP